LGSFEPTNNTGTKGGYDMLLLFLLFLCLGPMRLRSTNPLTEMTLLISMLQTMIGY
jgi:hypothetical protein